MNSVNVLAFLIAFSVAMDVGLFHVCLKRISQASETKLHIKTSESSDEILELEDFRAYIRVVNQPTSTGSNSKA